MQVKAQDHDKVNRALDLLEWAVATGRMEFALRSAELAVDRLENEFDLWLQRQFEDALGGQATLAGAA